MVIPKYKCGDSVLVYDGGKMITKIINKIQIIVSDSRFKVGYQFDEESFFKRSLMHDFYKDESEVFKSIEEFVENNS